MLHFYMMTPSLALHLRKSVTRCHKFLISQLKSLHVQEWRCGLSTSSSSSSLDVTKLTSREEENILFVMNTYSKEQLETTGVLSPLVLDGVYNHRSQQGPFVSLGEVLSLPGMENEIFKKICNSFLTQDKKPRVLRRDSEYLKYFSPSLSTDLMENVQTVTSLEVCVDSVCYASATRSQQVTAWDHVALLGTQHSKQSPAQILEQAVHVVPHIPQADIYLIETRMTRKISPQYMQILLFIARLQSALQTLLSSERLTESGQHSFFHVRDSFVMNMFDLRVGGEKVSGQSIVQQMKDGDCTNKIYVPPNSWHKYHKLETGLQKERFANCLLLTAGFIDYIGSESEENPDR